MRLLGLAAGLLVSLGWAVEPNPNPVYQQLKKEFKQAEFELVTQRYELRLVKDECGRGVRGACERIEDLEQRVARTEGRRDELKRQLESQIPCNGTPNVR